MPVSHLRACAQVPGLGVNGNSRAVVGPMRHVREAHAGRVEDDKGLVAVLVGRDQHGVVHRLGHIRQPVDANDGPHEVTGTAAVTQVAATVEGLKGPAIARGHHRLARDRCVVGGDDLADHRSVDRNRHETEARHKRRGCFNTDNFAEVRHVPSRARRRDVQTQPSSFIARPACQIFCMCVILSPSTYITYT